MKKKKLIPLVWDDKEEWNSPPPKFGSIYGYAQGFNPSLDYIMPKKVEDSPEEAARLYKQNFGNKKADSEPIFLVGPSWNDIDNWFKKAYTNYCKLFEADTYKRKKEKKDA